MIKDLLERGKFSIEKRGDGWNIMANSDPQFHGYNLIRLTEPDKMKRELFALIENCDDIYRVLKHVQAVIYASEHWWIDSPGRGGFNAAQIDSLLTRIENLYNEEQCTPK